MTENERENRCAAQHFGIWAVEELWMNRAVASVRAGVWTRFTPLAQAEADERGPLFVVDRGGIATISIVGQMTKGISSFGGTSTVRTRRALRRAAVDPKVRGILLRVDSPGGTVAGMTELAQDIRLAGQRRPIHAHIEDLGASAGYWAASQAQRVTANLAALVGSIGIYAVVYDESRRAEAEGVKAYVVKTGPHKGDLVPGTPVTEELLDEVRERVDHFNDLFVADVAAGRHVGERVVRETWASGTAWPAVKARNKGLIDSVESFEAAVTELKREIRNRGRRESRQRAVAMAEARIGVR